jgi:hypothetical protein
VGMAHPFTTHKSGCPVLLAFVARGRGLLTDRDLAPQISASEYWLWSALTLVDETSFGVPRSLRSFRKGRVLASRRRPALLQTMQEANHSHRLESATPPLTAREKRILRQKIAQLHSDEPNLSKQQTENREPPTENWCS